MFIDYFMFVIFFILIMLLTIIIRNKIRGFRYSDLLRSFFFFTPFLLPFIYFNIPSFQWNVNINAYLISITSSMIGLIIHWKDLKSFFNIEFYYFLEPLKTKWFLISQLSLIGSCFFEELFYRGISFNNNPFIAIIIASTLFSLSHYIQKPTRDKFNKKSYIVLFLISIGWSTSYYISNSIIPAIIGHLVFNLPQIISTSIHYLISKKITEEDIYE